MSHEPENGIAIVGVACEYPDARSPAELWENVLAERRAFRRLPAERLPEDYWSADPTTPDATYARMAAVLEGWEFDRLRFKVSPEALRSADLAHWLALDVASRALDAAGFEGGRGLPRPATGVVLGNTLTGEFSRAALLRLRWPYVRRVVTSELAALRLPEAAQQAFLANLERRYKEPFAPVGEETLAGGLSNTIAGRICNHFDLGGGGFTVDAACASSLLAICQAASALAAGDLDVALCGGVDLSLDPFELVGFAKAGALARDEMRVYDVRSQGFWPGEGCGFVVLMRERDARSQERRVLAVLRGWGVSSDGSGGLTRPELAGQVLALERAYRRAGFGIDSVGLFEGHGTGTAVGDATEIAALSQARRAARPSAAPAALGSIKANIGHTKAAAGVAGLIKAVMALEARLLPPATGCEEPHALLGGEQPALRLLRQAEAWPNGAPPRAGVSAMGFGGINTHVVLEAFTAGAPRAPARLPLPSAQDAEVFLLAAADRQSLQQQVERLQEAAPGLAFSELADLAAAMAQDLASQSQPAAVRAAVVARRPDELAHRLGELARRLAENTFRLDAAAGIFAGAGEPRPRIGFLFPGQGSPAHVEGGALRRRFAAARNVYRQADLPRTLPGNATEVAQPAIATASLAGLAVLQELGIEAEVAVGHSLGELVAWHWAGALDAAALLRLVAARGRAFADLAGPHGTMASVAADAATVEGLLAKGVGIAGCNGPRQTVVSGHEDAVAALVARARSRGIAATRLAVSHAFHSPLVAQAGPALKAIAEGATLAPLHGRVASTIDGAVLAADADLRDLLVRQVTSPVRFEAAVRAVDAHVDLWIEVGPGTVLTGLVGQISAKPALPLDAGGDSLVGLLSAAAAAHCLGVRAATALFAGRRTKPFDLGRPRRFLASPCEAAVATSGAAPSTPVTEPAAVAPAAATTPLDVVRALVAAETGLPVLSIEGDHRLLGDLHLTSLAVGRIVTEAARRLDLPAPAAPTAFATATVLSMVRSLDELLATRGEPREPSPALPPGVASWVRAFEVALVEQPLPDSVAVREPSQPSAWRVLAMPGDPLGEALTSAFGTAAGGGVVVVVRGEPTSESLHLLLEGAQAALALDAAPSDRRFVLVEPGGGWTGFARSLFLESPSVATCAIDVPDDLPDAARLVVAEALAARGFVAVHYDGAHRRREPRLRLASPEPLAASDRPALGRDDVLLVTGGGKGIGAECALALATASGCRLALLGRADPTVDQGLRDNLARFAAAGARAGYFRADVTEPAAVRDAVARAERSLGPVTAILHAAGINEPAAVAALDVPQVERALAPKLAGLRHVLAAVDRGSLRLLVTFGSVIARAGLRGEAHYALANDQLAALTERVAAEAPGCRALCVEWSVWKGTGMGERLGRVEALARDGIAPIAIEDGVAMLLRLLADRREGRVVVTGRLPELPTMPRTTPDLPFLRFLEKPLVHVAEVELVVESTLSAASDPWIDDHVLQGERLLPAVLALEAMAQAALPLIGQRAGYCFETVELLRAVRIPARATVTIRVAALRRDDGSVDLVLRSSETAFQADCVRATLLAVEGALPVTMPMPATNGEVLAAAPLYASLLFQSGRFERVGGYRFLHAAECVADLQTESSAPWFARWLPGELVLGDPGRRDGAIHAVQACIPHATVLPTGADRITCFAPGTAGRRVHARERASQGGTFVYDLEVLGDRGEVVERWEGLRLLAVDRREPGASWPPALLGPWLEWRLRDVLPGIEILAAFSGAGSAAALRQALGEDAAITRRPDGKPLVAGGPAVSVTHLGGVTLALAGPGRLACDLAPIESSHSGGARTLLGATGLALAELVSRQAHEDLATGSARVWAARECLVKAGLPPDTPLVLDRLAEGGWILLASGDLRIATCTVTLGTAPPCALAVLAARPMAPR